MPTTTRLHMECGLLCLVHSFILGPLVSVAAVSLPSSFLLFDRRACILRRFNRHVHITDAHVCRTSSALLSSVQAGKVAGCCRQPGMQRHNGRLCGTDVEVVCTRVRGVRSSVVHFSQLSSCLEGSRIYLVPLVVTFSFACSLASAIPCSSLFLSLSALRIY